MGDMLACLRGWHPGLAKAELAALLPEARLENETSARWVRVAGASEARRTAALQLASGLQCFLHDGVVTATEATSEDEWLARMATYVEAHPVKGRWRFGLGSKGQKFRAGACPPCREDSEAYWSTEATPWT